MSYRFCWQLNTAMVHVIQVLLTAEHSNGICHTGFANTLLSCQQTCMTYTIAVCTVRNSWWWQRNCPKHVEFYSKNKYEKLVHLVCFIIRIYQDARSPERQISIEAFGCGRYVCYLQQDAFRFAVTITRLHLYISVQVVFTWLT